MYKVPTYILYTLYNIIIYKSIYFFLTTGACSILFYIVESCVTLLHIFDDFEIE